MLGLIVRRKRRSQGDDQKIQEKGDKAKAIEHYEKCLDLWKDVDPGIAEVEGARERLTELKSQ